MKHIDLFSGIGGFTLAAQHVWKDKYVNAGHSEVDKNACHIYHHHYPDSECLGSINEIEKVDADIITAGFPCQDLSVAGKRAGLAGKESGLFWRLARVIGLSQPKWFVIENVPGLLSSNGGKDFWLVITTLEQFGYCVSWRILDAQYFGVAQRRKRVWIVGSLGNIGSAKVLFKPESRSGNDTAEQEVGARGLCISSRCGERHDPTDETFIAHPVGTIDGSNGTKGGGTNLIAKPLLAHEKGWHENRNNTDENIIAQTIRKHGEFNSATGRGGGNFVAQTIGATQRGNASFVWQDTHIAEINPDRKGKTDGLSRRIHGRLSDGVRGKALGNSIVPAVVIEILHNIKQLEHHD